MLLLLSAASCCTDQEFSGSGLPKLQFVGDSITVGLTPDINAHDGAMYDLSIHALTGMKATSHGAASQVTLDATSNSNFEVIELGTNDAKSDVDDSTTLDAFAAEFPASTCLVFVTVNSHNPSWGPGIAQTINEHIRSNFAHVADWDAAWDASYFDVADDPHPNEVGRQALLGIEDAAIATCP